VKDPYRLTETGFDPARLAHLEAVMAQGNGYLGLRGVHEEEYPGSVRGLYIADVFNKACGEEVTELANLADVTGFDLELDGEAFRLDRGALVSYSRGLSLNDGELCREVVWRSGKGRTYRLSHRRFVSLENKHLVVCQIAVTPLSGGCSLAVRTGINGRMTNSGAQNTVETEKRVLQNRYLRYRQTTTQSGIEVTFTSLLQADADGATRYCTERRQLLALFETECAADRTITLTKKTLITTSLDPQRADGLAALQAVEALSYDTLLARSKAVWEAYPAITLESAHNFDQQIVAFLRYHLRIAQPWDARFSIGAKAMTGEGYKGHVFWDTEIFLLPFYLHSDPAAAKRLLQYRCDKLNGAMQKAAANGYKGALFPWESADTGAEETPEFAAMNIKTGVRERVCSAETEHHISADIAYAILEYEKATGDTAFMREGGLRTLVEVARFWVSRADQATTPYSINNVTGPDEYTEHINNNAYTNYMARYVVEKTLQKAEEHGYPLPDADRRAFADFCQNLYLPPPNADHVIPQDDTFLTKPCVEIGKYREQAGRQTILQDYTRAEVVGLQVLKQADVVMLLYLLPHLFSKEVAAASWRYYEPKTIHDSSLSKCIHSLTAARRGDAQQAYAYFEEGARIDLGSAAQSGAGIHAASLGAVYLAIAFGFCGISVAEDALLIRPALPAAWRRVTLPFVYRGVMLTIEIDATSVKLSRDAATREIRLTVFGQEVLLRQNQYTAEINVGGKA
jgi:hypothetical glycosyl hydrolase